MNKIVIITGPTAVGKTKCSLEIAKRFNTDIINGDAYQIYKYMNIGTAKPTASELKMINHHFIDFLDPSEEYNIYKYQTEVRHFIDEEITNNKLPLIVGGSGLYLESIFCNYELNEEFKNPDFENKYINYSNDELFNLLNKINPELANKTHSNNRKRVLRYLEKCENHNLDNEKKNELIYDALVIFLNDDRDILYNHINQRVDEMINNGLLAEVKELKNYNLSKTARQAIGYKELFSFLDDEISYEEAIEKIKQNSRNYAKRQLTWFRNKKYLKVVNINRNNFNETIDEVEELIKNFL